MAMSNNIGGPNFNNPNLSRLPNSASGQPAAETGADFNTTDAVNLGGPGKLAPNGKDTRGPSVEAETLRPAAQQPASGGVNNAPTVLTVGELSAPTHHHHEIGLNGIGRSYIETAGEGLAHSREKAFQVVAGQKPLDN